MERGWQLAVWQRMLRAGQHVAPAAPSHRVDFQKGQTHSSCFFVHGCSQGRGSLRGVHGPKAVMPSAVPRPLYACQCALLDPGAALLLFADLLADATLQTCTLRGHMAIRGLWWCMARWVTSRHRGCCAAANAQLAVCNPLLEPPKVLHCRALLTWHTC